MTAAIWAAVAVLATVATWDAIRRWIAAHAVVSANVRRLDVLERDVAELKNKTTTLSASAALRARS